MKNKLFLKSFRAAALLAVLVFTACPTSTAPGVSGQGPDLTAREAHLAMLKNLGVNINPALPVAPNGAAYNPQTSVSASRARAATGPEQSLGPLGKIFSQPKREIFLAGYGNSNSGSDKTHGLYEDFENGGSLTLLGRDSKSKQNWDNTNSNFPRKSVAADLDGDGIDEVVIVTLNKTSNRILINKGVYNGAAFTVTQVREFNAPDTVVNMVSETNYLQMTAWKLIAADLNGDGKQECVLALPGKDASNAYLYVLDNSLAPTQINITQYATGFPAEGRRFPMITAADYDQDGKDEICLVIGVNATNFNMSYIILDDRDAGYQKLAGGLVANAAARLKTGNVVAGDFTGDGLPDTVFYGLDSTSNKILLLLLKTSLDHNFSPDFQFAAWSEHWATDGSRGLFPRLAAGDADGDRKTDLYAYNSLWTLDGAGKFKRMTGTATALWSPADWYNDYETVMGDVTGDQRDDVVFFHGNGNIQIYYRSGGSYHHSLQNISSPNSYHETGCLPNVDNDSFILQDTGDRELLFSDPQVIAVLASPPYYTGINEGGDGGTSFGYSSSSGSGTSDKFGFSVGASLGHEFNLPLIGGTEFKVSVEASFAWAQSSSVELNESWGWNNSLAQDLVVFTAIPFDVYYYKVLRSPPGEDAEPGDILTVNVPRKPMPYHMPLLQYNTSVPEEHRVTVNHTLGRPATYFDTTQRDAQKSAAGDKGLFSTNTQMSAGSGTGSTTINIESVKTTEDSFAFDLETKIEAEATAGSVKVGVSAGFNYGYESTSSVSEGTYIEGTVPAIPSGSYSSDKDFTWGLMAYPKSESGQNYILVTYWTNFSN